jgi:quinol monooxygenase YgiN
MKDTIWTYGYMPCQRYDSIRRAAMKVNVMYDDKWYQDYLSKDPNRFVLDNVWAEPDAIQEYHPSKEVQEACKGNGKAAESRNGNLHLCETFTEWVDDEGIEYDAIAVAE